SGAFRWRYHERMATPLSGRMRHCTRSGWQESVPQTALLGSLESSISFDLVVLSDCAHGVALVRAASLPAAIHDLLHSSLHDSHRRGTQKYPPGVAQWRPCRRSGTTVCEVCTVRLFS